MSRTNLTCQLKKQSKEAWPRSGDRFPVLGPLPILGTVEAMDMKFGTWMECVRYLLACGWQIIPKWDVVGLQRSVWKSVKQNIPGATFQADNIAYLQINDSVCDGLAVQYLSFALAYLDTHRVTLCLKKHMTARSVFSTITWTVQRLPLVAKIIPDFDQPLLGE